MNLYIYCKIILVISTSHYTSSEIRKTGEKKMRRWNGSKLTYVEKGQKRKKKREIVEKEIGHSYLNFKMWPILHSHRAESARRTCKVYEETAGQKKGDRNNVIVAMIYMPYFSINQTLVGDIEFVHDDHKFEVYRILLISFTCIPLRGLNSMDY